MQILAANHLTENGVSNGGVGERTEENEGVCNPIGKTTISTIQTPPHRPVPAELPGTKPPTKEDPWLQSHT